MERRKTVRPKDIQGGVVAAIVFVLVSFLPPLVLLRHVKGAAIVGIRPILKVNVRVVIVPHERLHVLLLLGAVTLTPLPGVRLWVKLSNRIDRVHQLIKLVVDLVLRLLQIVGAKGDHYEKERYQKHCIAARSESPPLQQVFHR